MSKQIIAPSLLAADWGRLAEEIDDVIKAGADWLHFDVMDGQFVPPITFGAQLVAAARKLTDKTLDVHLMIEQPENQIDRFVDAGANLVTVHVEACPHLHRVLQQIKSHGIQAGVALNPGTPLSSIEHVIDLLDLVLIMTVNPGWGGQAFIPNSLDKIKAAKKLLGEKNSKALIEVDGGINAETAAAVAQAGAEVLVAGTAVFGESDRTSAINALRCS